MTEPSSTNPTDAVARRSLLSWLLVPLSLFPLVALLTYDWQSIQALNTPPEPSSNWIGALGDGFAYCGYTVFGLAIWIVPILCLTAVFCLVRGHRLRPARRELWLVVLLVSLSCLVQVLGVHGGLADALAHRINTLFSRFG